MEELKVLLKDTLKELIKYCERAMPDIEQMANNFYSGEEKAINDIPVLLDGIQWILDVIAHAEFIQNEELPFELLRRSIIEEIKNLEDALEYKDWTMFGDILQYQTLPLFEKVREISIKAVKVL